MAARLKVRRAKAGVSRGAVDVEFGDAKGKVTQGRTTSSIINAWSYKASLAQVLAHIHILAFVLRLTPAGTGSICTYRNQ